MSFFDLFSLFDRFRRPLSTRSEPFHRVHPKDNFYQSAGFFPMPFALVTTVNAQGVTSIGPHSLAFPFDIIEQPSMMVISRSSSNTSTNLQRGSKAALHFVEYRESWLKPIVALGYPGTEPEEKMKNIPFEMVRTPTPEYAADPEFPLLISDAFEVFECELDGEFQYQPGRETDPSGCEKFWCLKVKNILLKESFHERLLAQKEFPSIPLSYGFRHNEAGDRRFFFCSHNRPKPVPIPMTEGLKANSIYYTANKLDPEVRFELEACQQLVDAPRALLTVALRGIIREAKKQGVTMVDAEFVRQVNAKRRA
jgi:flavin reductase (DIM6/NTAB) family NADH-FMN oxidoreductase RutF